MESAGEGAKKPKAKPRAPKRKKDEGEAAAAKKKTSKKKDSPGKAKAKDAPPKKRKAGKKKEGDAKGDGKPASAKKPKAKRTKKSNNADDVPVPPAAKPSAAASVGAAGVAAQGGGGDDPSSADRPSYMGVTYRPAQSKYSATLVDDRTGREYDLGLFDLACDAALAYDAARRITGSPAGGGNNVLIDNDVEEIKYALNWLDRAEGGREGRVEDVGVNFARPSRYREARQIELGSYITGKVYHPSFDLKGIPKEEALKVRIKKEILNLAKAYVEEAAQAVAQQGAEAQAQVQVDDVTGRTSTPAAGSISSANEEKKRRLPKKKRWIPEADTAAHDMDDDAGAEALLSLQRNAQTSNDSDEAAQAEAQAQVQQAEAQQALEEATRLALKKKRENEKKGALALRLERMMNSGAGGAPDPSTAATTTSSSPAAAASSIETEKEQVKAPSEVAVAGLASASMKGMGQNSVSAAGALQSNTEVNQEDAARQLQLSQLLQHQQALDRLRAGGAHPSLLGAAAGNGDPITLNPAFQQAILLASQRGGQGGGPANEALIRQLVLQEQQAKERVVMAMQAQAQAQAQQAPGMRSPLPNAAQSSSLIALQQQQQQQQQQQLQQAALAAQVSAVDEKPAAVKTEEETPEKAPSNSSALPAKKPETPVGQQQQDQANARSSNEVAALLASMGHRGPVPPGLAEQLENALKQQREQQQREQQLQLLSMQAGSNADPRLAVAEDPRLAMQRQMENEARRAALAQRLSAAMGGNGGAGQDNAASIQGHLLNAVKSNPSQEQEAVAKSNSLLSDVVKSNQGAANQDDTMQQDGASEEARESALQHSLQARLQAIQALQGLSSNGGGGDRARLLQDDSSMDEQAMIQDLILKKQMNERNKAALEGKIQDYIQGKAGPPPQQQQPLPDPLAASARLSEDILMRQRLQEQQQQDILARQQQHLALQSLLQREGGGAPPQLGLGLQQSDLVQQAALQSLLAGQQQRAAAAGQPQAAQPNLAADALTHDMVHRRIAIESMLLSEESRLRNLRETLQGQFVSHPGLGQAAAAGLQGINGGQAAPQDLGERSAMLANDEFRKALLEAEMKKSAAAQADQQWQQQQMSQQELNLRQVLALRAAAAPQAPAAAASGTPPIMASAAGAESFQGRLLEEAARLGLDPRTMTPGQLAQLMRMAP